MNDRCGIQASPGTQHGMAMIAALFMIIVVAAFGAFALRIGGNQQETAKLQLQGNRAFAAAFSGLEWASDRAFNGGNCLANAVIPYNGFTLTVTCTVTANHATSAGANFQVYDLRATAQSTAGYGSPDFVQRTLERRVGNIPPGVW